MGIGSLAFVILEKNNLCWKNVKHHPHLKQSIEFLTQWHCFVTIMAPLNLRSIFHKSFRALLSLLGLPLSFRCFQAVGAMYQVALRLQSPVAYSPRVPNALLQQPPFQLRRKFLVVLQNNPRLSVGSSHDRQEIDKIWFAEIFYFSVICWILKLQLLVDFLPSFSPL